MNKIYQAIIACAFVCFLGTQANAVKVNFTNASRYTIFINWNLTSGINRSIDLEPGQSHTDDTFLAGVTKVMWMQCGKIYEYEPDILGTEVVTNQVTIKDGGALYFKSSKLFKPVVETVITPRAQKNKCPCMLEGNL